MVEREARVVAIDGGVLSLQPLPGDCAGCSGGCRGRCNLFPVDERGELSFVPGVCPQDLRVGERVRLGLDEAVLRRAAFAGYGRAWLGLVLGAVAGHLLAVALGLPRDVLTLVGLVAGTVWLVRRSKQHTVTPRVERLVSAATVPTPDSQPLESNRTP